MKEGIIKQRTIFILKALSYLDIHTHLRINSENCVEIASLSMDEILQESTYRDYSCAGIHPWWLEETTPQEIDLLKTHIENMTKNGKLWAIGETGLDRLYPEFLDQQKILLDWHMALAENYHLPLILHNVRAGSDFLEILKKNSPKVPWLFHDFRGNEELVSSLLKLHPDCYFSFGISLDNSPQVRELLPLIPLENIFLETDNQKHLDIHDIYLRAAENLHLDLDFLKSQIWFNFQRFSRAIH